MTPLPSCRWRRQFHAGDDRAVAAGAMAQTEALALIGAMLPGEPGHGRYLHYFRRPHYILYGEPRMKCNAQVCE